MLQVSSTKARQKTSVSYDDRSTSLGNTSTSLGNADPQDDIVSRFMVVIEWDLISMGIGRGEGVQS